MNIWYAPKIHPFYWCIWPNYAHSKVELSFPPKFLRKWSTDVVLENVRLFVGSTRGLVWLWLPWLFLHQMLSPTVLSRLPWLFGKRPFKKNHPHFPGCVFVVCFGPQPHDVHVARYLPYHQDPRTEVIGIWGEISQEVQAAWGWFIHGAFWEWDPYMELTYPTCWKFTKREVQKKSLTQKCQNW